MLSTIKTICTATNAIVTSTANTLTQAIEGASTEVKHLRIQRTAEITKEFRQIMDENPNLAKDYQAFKDFVL